TQGPRSPGAPTVYAGPDITVASSATLNGAVSGSGVTSLWYPYPGAPGTVSFGSAGAAVTTATFSAPGNYTLMLRATDAVHAPAYDAVVVTVTAGTGTTSGSGSTSGTSGMTSTAGGTGGSDPGGSGGGSCGVGGLAAMLGTFAAWRRRRPG
nr:hypothetical protein [Planctomycetota bacterium]